MDEKVTPQTKEKGKLTKGKKIALIVSGSVAAAIVVVYMLLCAWTSMSDTILPGVYAGGVDMGGMTREEAQQALDDWAGKHYGQVTYTIHAGDAVQEFDGKYIVVNAEDIAQRAWQIGRSESFLARGAVIVSRLVGLNNSFDCNLSLSPAGERAFEQAMTLLNEEAGSELVETAWVVDGSVLKITRGTASCRVNWPETKQNLLEVAQTSDETKVDAVLVTAEPKEMDMDQLYSQVHTQAKDAVLDTKTYEVTDHVVGVDFDLEQAKAQFAEVPAGETLRVPLKLTTPEVTKQKLSAKLFCDVLGTCETNVGGTANRLSNVTLAAKSLNGVVLAPGQVFSYNATLGPRTVARGYKSAPAYVSGKTVNEIGGGICQGSSTLYLAVLRSNLQIVERKNHSYSVAYMPKGMDATVAYNSVDFKFKNDTKYPIRIRASVQNRVLTISIEGTMEKPFTVKMESETLATMPAGVVYKASSSVAPGKTVVETTAYSGSKVRTYRNVYDGNGKLISRTVEAISTYLRRDKVILYNPADGGQYGGGGTTAPVDPNPAPVDPNPAPVDPNPAPSNPDPAPAPSNPDPAPAPSNPDPAPAPSNPEPAPAPAPSNPEPAPAPSNPEPAPSGE